MSPDRLRALIVDDQAEIRTMLRIMLERQGLGVVEWEPGQDVVEVARAERPDVVILDWGLPGESGLAVCRRLTADPDLQDIPVVMFTGLSDSRDRHAARHAGAAAFITKGADAAQIEAKVREVVAQRRAERRDAADRS